MKKLILMIFLMIFLVGSVSAFEFDNTLRYENNDMKVTIENGFGLPLFGSDLGTIELKSHKKVNEVLRFGFGEEEVVMYYDFTNWELYSNGLGEVYFTDKRTEKVIEKDYYFVYWGEKERNVYGDSCGLSINGTRFCESVIIGTETYNNWINYNSKDIPNKNIRIGIKVYVDKGDYIDAIWKIAGKKIKKHAEWTADLNVNLVSVYELNEQDTTGSGTIIDEQGNNTATNNGADNTTGKLNTAYNFVTSNSDFINVPDSASLDFTGSFSISVWVNWDTLAQTAQIVTKSINGGRSFELFWITDTLFWDVFISTTQKRISASSTGITTGSYFHIVATYKAVGAGTSETRLYIQSVESASRTDLNVGVDTGNADLQIGAREFVGSRQFFDGQIDQVLIYDRALSLAEVQQIFNSDVGIEHTVVFDPPVVNLDSPINAFNSSSKTIIFNGTASDDKKLINVSLILDGIINETNSSGLNNSLYTFVISNLAEGNHNWTIEAVDNESQSITAPTRTFTIDTTLPRIDITSPIGNQGRLTVGESLQVNFTLIEATPNICLFDYNSTNITTSCSNNFTINYEFNNNDIIIWAIDNVGNLNFTVGSWTFDFIETGSKFSNTTIEGAREEFILNVTLNPSLLLASADLIYNGSSSSGSFVNIVQDNYTLTRTITIPAVSTDTNVTFLWNLTLSSGSSLNSSSNNQTIRDLNLGNCSVNTNVVMNLTLRDEESQVFLGGSAFNTSIEVDIDISPFGLTTPVIEFSQLYNQTNPAEVCINIALPTTVKYRLDSTIKYRASERVSEQYNIQNFTLQNTSIPQNINLFDLLSADSTEFRITFKDSNFIIVENALIQISRQYVSEGTFKTVEIPKTDSNGQTVAHLVDKDVVYNIVVTKDGEVLGTFNNLVAFCEDELTGSCFITLNALQANEVLFNYDSTIGLVFSFNYNETTRLLNFTFTTVDGSTKNITLTSVKMDQLGNTSVCFESLISSSGVVSCSVPSSVGNETIVVEIFVDGVLKLTNWISGGSDFDIGDAGFFLLLILVLSLGLMLIESKTGIIIGVLVGFISASLFSWTTGGIIGIGSSIVWLAIAGIILIWKLNMDNQT